MTAKEEMAYCLEYSIKFMYPVFFLLFNVIYWTYYLTHYAKEEGKWDQNFRDLSSIYLIELPAFEKKRTLKVFWDKNIEPHVLHCNVCLQISHYYVMHSRETSHAHVASVLLSR